MSLTREQVQSTITQYIKPNLRQEITGAVLQNVLVTMLQNLVMLGEGGGGVVIQFCNNIFEIDWSTTRQSNNVFWRVSSDNGDTFSAAMYDPNYLYSLLRGGSVPTTGDTLLKLHNRLATTEADLATLEAAWELTPDDVQSLQDIIDLIDANPETFEEALFTKLNTTTFNSFLEQYALDLAGKSNTGHTHTMANITGLVAALAAKADASTVISTKEQVMALGFYSATEVDELISALQNTLPDVQTDSAVVRNRANVVAWDGEFTYGAIDIKLGRNGADGIFNGEFNATLLMYMYAVGGVFTPVIITLCGNTQSGVWQNATAVANADTDLFTNIQFCHTATDLYIRVNLNLIDEGAQHTAFVQQYSCRAINNSALMQAENWAITDPFNNPLTLTADVTATIGEPINSSDVEPFTF